ncbi:MAG: hypothetical protein JW984_00015 [Deltaproteobacteria bacterium]|uniref:DUF5723 domain-containing protein n=1 Tax=Candidatus Zymogenus saltonus TaxID=2844893 RepID=A0A9D8PMY9_9DELT|nr:hypothetical protein [Candidatus Zymogenus saltonus]
MRKLIVLSISLTLSLALAVSSYAIKWENKSLETGGEAPPTATSDSAVKNYNECFKKEILEDPKINTTPKLLLKLNASIWNSDFQINPALLEPKSEYEFYYDIYYLGGLTRVSTDIYNEIMLNATQGDIRGAFDEAYVSNAIGTDVGFLVKLNDISNLGAIFSYKNNLLKGDGSFKYEWSYPATFSGDVESSFRSKADSNTYGISLLYNVDLTDYLSLGAGFKYAYTLEKSVNDATGYGVATGPGGEFPENVSTDREMTFKYHLFAPTLGVSVYPTDFLILNSSVTGNIYTGRVEKKASLFADHWSNVAPGNFPSNTYEENLNSGRIKGYEISANLKPEYKINDIVSILAVADYFQRDIEWKIDGMGVGYFAPFNYPEIFYGDGTVEYQGKQRQWEIESGAGVKLSLDGFDLRGNALYTHYNLYSAYYHENVVDDGLAMGSGFNSFTRRMEEEMDIMSLTFGVGKEFTPELTADLSIRYDLGWGEMSLYEANHSPYISGDPSTITYVRVSDTDSYQDLTLATSMTITPMSRLSLVFGGMVTMPLSSLNYNLKGYSTGGSDFGGSGFPYSYDGDSARGYNSRGWNYGGSLRIRFEF